MELNRCYVGDCRDILRDMAAAEIRVQTCITSPPYWGLRDYGIEPSVWGGLPECEHVWGDEITVHKGGPSGETSGLTNRGAHQARNKIADIRAGQFCQCGAWLGTLGLEPDYRMYVDHMVEVMELVREVLADDGTLWLNLGDSYASDGAGRQPTTKEGPRVPHGWANRARPERAQAGGDLKPKDLCLMPARVAIAMQQAGWWVRQDIIWHKPNPMPESITDRCTKAHEYIFLLSKARRYYYDADAIKEPASDIRDYKEPDGWDTTAGDGGHGSIHKRGRDKGRPVRDPGNKTHKFQTEYENSGDERHRTAAGLCDIGPIERANKRSVWTISTQPYPDAHFATFPTKLIEPCVLAGSRKGDVVLDPFMGSGTTAQVAEHLSRQWVGCELNPEYLALQRERLRQQSLDL